MAVILVDHSRLQVAADAVDTYLDTHEGRMKQADERMENLGSKWTDEDYYASKIKWQQLNGSDSTSDHMIKALKHYRDLLLYAKSEYQNAQSSAINSSLLL